MWVIRTLVLLHTHKCPIRHASPVAGMTRLAEEHSSSTSSTTSFLDGWRIGPPLTALRSLAVNSVEEQTRGFQRAGDIGHRGLNLAPDAAPEGRSRHTFGDGPFARLVMPRLPAQPGLYLWEQDGRIVYVGQTRTPLSKRLGPLGYATISRYNTLARQPGRTNGGQQTNCRVNALANQALAEGHRLAIWHRVTSADQARIEEARWMATHGKPEWNRRLEQERSAPKLG